MIPWTWGFTIFFMSFFNYNLIFLEWLFFKMFKLIEKFSSVQFSCSVVSNSLQPHELQHARRPCLTPTPGVYSNSRPSSRWCHPAISSSVVPFSFCPQSLPASESFPMSQLFTWGGQSTGVSALASFLSKNTQGSSPLEWTGWISLQSKGLSRVFSNTTVQKHQFFGTQLTVAYQAPLSMGFSRQEYWKGLPFPSPMHESEKRKWSCSVMPDS